MDTNSYEYFLEQEGHALKEVLLKSGLVYKLPLRRLASKLSRSDQKRVYDYIERDQRAETDLYIPVINAGPQRGELNILLIGNTHIPYFSSLATKHGFSTLIMGSYIEGNLREGELDPDNPYHNNELNSIISVLRFAAKYEYENLETSSGYPLLIIGDTHGQEYITNFPAPTDLKRAGISTANLYIEGITLQSDARQQAAKGFWGQANAVAYLDYIEQEGISVEAIGIEAGRISGGFFFNLR